MRTASIVCALVFIASTATAEPVTFVLDLGGLPGSAILVDGTPTPVPQGLVFTINVDTTTVDTWGPSDFGLFPASSVYLSSPDLGFSNVQIVTPLAYFEDIPPIGTSHARLGLSSLFPDSGANLELFPPDTAVGAFGDVNVIDILPTVYGAGSFTGPFGFTLETGEFIQAGQVSWTGLPVEAQEFGPSSLTTVPEPSTLALLAVTGTGLFALRRRLRSRRQQRWPRG